MEGERAFVQELATLRRRRSLLEDNDRIPYKYSLGGGYKTSSSWEPLGPTGCYDTFGPELSFGQTLQRKVRGPIAIAKFTHSGSQIIDWTPAGSVAESRNIYPEFCAFVHEAIAELTTMGHVVDLAGIFYHVGENDMSFGPYRREAPARIQSIISQSREDLGFPGLRWYVSQQPPTDHERVNDIDVTGELARVAAEDDNFIHIKAFDLPEQVKKLVLDTEGVVQLGELLATTYLEYQ